MLPVKLRNEPASSVSFRSMRIRPSCSTTNTRCESAGGAATYGGLKKDVPSAWSVGVPGGGGGGGRTVRKLLHAAMTGRSTRIRRIDPRLRTRNYPIQCPAIRHQVELTASVFAEGDHAAPGRHERGEIALRGGGSAGVLEATHHAATVVHVQVIANELCHARAAIHIAALHVTVAADVLVVDDREREPGLVAPGRDTVRSLHGAPAVIQSLAGIRRGRDVHLFPRGVADVADVEIAGRPVE